MSTYAQMQIGQHPVLWFRNGVSADVLYLFQRDEFVEGAIADPPGGNDWDTGVRVLHATVRTLRERLDVSGIVLAAAASAYGRHILEELELGISQEVPAWEPEDGARDSHARWLARASRYLNTPAEGVRIEVLEALLEDWEDDEPRFVLRSFLEVAKPDEAVTIDLGDLIDAGWLEQDLDPHAHAVEALGQSMVPAIVVTEGRSDAEAIRVAMAVLRPHLVPYVRVLDFEAKPEGGADGALRTVRSLAAAGVANPVVLLLDNDTAGRRAQMAAAPAALALPGATLAGHLPGSRLSDARPLWSWS